MSIPTGLQKMRRSWFTAATALGVLFAGSACQGSETGTEPQEFRVFDADLGPTWIDVSAYPPEQQSAYALFARKCSKCHTLARPINSSLQGEEWIAYVNRMSKKPGSGIAPKDARAIQDFLIFDSSRRERGGQVDPELLPFLQVSRELRGVDRFPASLRDIRPGEEPLRVKVEGDRRLDLSRFLDLGDGQRLAKWTRRTPNEGELVLGQLDTRDSPRPVAPEPAVEADLLAAVEEAVGETSDVRERVELILDWIDEEISHVYRKGTADVGTVLRDREGDATEITSTFVHMARAAGVPARECLGFVARRTAFHLHTWAEVWIDGWIPVDPYLGQLPADDTHIRLVAPEEAITANWDPGRVPGLDRLNFRVITPEGEEGGSSI